MVKQSAKEKIKLQTEKRKVVGRKVKNLRREGVLPANIYGKKVKSLAVQVDLKSFLPVYQKVGETGLVELSVKGESKLRPALVHNVQFHPVSDQPLHADFYQVDLKTKVTTEVPIELVGESPAVKEKSGVLIQPLNEVEVEALPAGLPDGFKVDLGELVEIGDVVKVESLKVPKGVKILTPGGEILAKVEPPTKEEEAPSEVKEAPAEEAAEGEAPAEKEAEKTTEGKPVEDKSKGAPDRKKAKLAPAAEGKQS